MTFTFPGGVRLPVHGKLLHAAKFGEAALLRNVRIRGFEILAESKFASHDFSCKKVNEEAM
jgi:hypothetical protein